MEINIRAWDQKNSYMAYKGQPDLETISSFIFHFGEDILMLGTGIKDINGDEVFVGDLLKDPESEPFQYETYHPVLYDSKTGQYCIDNSFKHDGSHLVNIVQYFGEHIEIAGNIYENPELIHKTE